VRLRLKESDIGRSQRQRQFLWAMRDQILNTNLLPRMPALYTAFSNTFSTDLSIVEIITLMQFGLGLDTSNVRAGGITLRELQSYTTEQGASVLVISDPARVRTVIDGIWDAPAMVDSRRQDSTACQPMPQGAPAVASNTTAPAVQPTAQPAAPDPNSLLPTPTPGPNTNVGNGDVALPEENGGS
jgi:hypothetical protein